jgi:glycosyltransferase involved in cell wall biosynthesis
LAYVFDKGLTISHQVLGKAQAVNKNFYFFSRDQRTHSLFRASWHLAAQQCGADANVVCRGFGWKKALAAVNAFIGASSGRRVIFGTSEICLYAIFSCRKDIWVFTGLGRLLIDGGFVARGVRTLLQWLYRGQQMVVLNEQDGELIRNSIGCAPTLIEGEGYKFLSLPGGTERPGNSITFAYIGRLLKSKGVDNLVESFARYSKPNWTLMVIGDNDFANRDSVPMSEFQRLAETSKGRIVFTGFQSDILNILRGVDVVISLSRREGLPFSVLDGIVAGAHIVLTPVPGHLSFRDFEGITFVDPSDLGRFFVSISENPKPFFMFDRDQRVATCEARFGQGAVTKSITSLLTAVTENSAC